MTTNMNTNTIHFTDNKSADPRCPYCGRPVIGTFVQGGEGKYHPECTRPPQQDHGPCVPVNPNPWLNPPWWVPRDHYPYRITCEGVEVRK